MTIPSATLNQIQQAGQSIHDTHQALIKAATQCGQDLIAAMAQQPFGLENDKLYVQCKTISRMAQEVQAIEAQFCGIYEAAAGLVTAETPVIVALTHTSARHSTPRKSVDVEEAKVVTAPKEKAPTTRSSGKKIPVGQPKPKPPKLTANEKSLFKVLSSVYSKREFKSPPSQSQLADSSGLPKGSIGFTLKQLVSKGVIVEGPGPQYKLA